MKKDFVYMVIDTYSPYFGELMIGSGYDAIFFNNHHRYYYERESYDKKEIVRVFMPSQVFEIGKL